MLRSLKICEIKSKKGAASTINSYIKTQLNLNKNLKFIILFKNSFFSFTEFFFEIISNTDSSHDVFCTLSRFFSQNPDFSVLAMDIQKFTNLFNLFDGFSSDNIILITFNKWIIQQLFDYAFSNGEFQQFLDYAFSQCSFFLTKNEIMHFLDAQTNQPAFINAINFQQIPAYKIKFDPDEFFILDKSTISKKLNLPFPDARNNQISIDYTPLIHKICPGYLNREYRCPNCGAALLKSKYKENCCNNIVNIRNHMPPETAPQSIIDIVTNYSQTKWNFIRTLNRYARPVLQKASYCNRDNSYSTLFVQGVTYCLDSRFQFTEPVYIMASGDSSISLQKPSSFSNEQFQDLRAIISLLFRENLTLNQFVNEKLKQFSRDDFIAFVKDSSDRNSSIAVITTDNPFQKSSALVAFYDTDLSNQNSPPLQINDYQTKMVPVNSALYDQLVYPLLYWNGQGGIGKLYPEEHWKSRDMRFALRAICLQPPQSYCKQCSVLLDEYLCSGYGRDLQIKVNKAFQIQMSLLSQKEALNGLNESVSESYDKDKNQFGIKTFIPATFTGSPAYWNSVAKNGFYLSMILGAPTFFITMTENPHWHEISALNTEKDIMMNSVLLARIFYQKKNSLISYIKKSKIFGEVKGYLWRDEYQKRGLPHCHILLWTDFDTSDTLELDKKVTCRLPLEDPYITNEIRTNQLKELSKTFMTHTCTQRCGGLTGKCCYGFPKTPHDATTIENNRVEFARNEGDELIVPHSPKLLALFRSHIDVEPVLSTSSIGYVLKYATKDSDSGDISFENIKYCGQEIGENDQLRRYAATHIVSAPEAYNSICGLRRQEMSPTIELLPIHEEGDRKIVVRRNETKEDIVKKIETSMSKLERYFARPLLPEFDNLKFCEYYSYYVVSKGTGGTPDRGDPVFSIRLKRKRSFCAIKFVKLTDHELFALRLLLQEIPAHSFDELRAGFATFWEAAKDLGLVENGQEFQTIMAEAIAIHRPPSDLRVLVVMLYEQGADFEKLISAFSTELEADLTNKNITLKQIFGSMFSSRNIPIPSYLKESEEEEEPSLTFEIEDIPSDVILNEGQKAFVNSVVNIVENHKLTHLGPYLMFLQGRAGTGKTFTTNYLITTLRKQGYNVLVTGTTGIAASQYQGGQTVHSLFALKIDQKIKDNEFTCNIGLGTQRSNQLKNADLIIIDEISMMTIKTATGVDYTLRYIVSSNYGYDEKDIEYDMIPPFGNIPILFVGDLLQLPPVIPGSHASVAQRLITRCEWWNEVILFGLFQPMRSLNITWAQHLVNIGNGNNGDLKYWNDLHKYFGITITRNFDEAVTFYLDDIDMRAPFPLCVQWICATNHYVDATNEFFFAKRREYVGILGKIRAFNEIKTELDKSDIANNLDSSEKFEFIKNMHHKDIPDSTLQFQVGEPVCVLRNLNTQEGIVKNKRCWVKTVMKYSVVVEFEDGSSYTIPRIKFTGITNGIHFVRTQVPLKPIFAGTVHKSQGMTLTKGVIDLRSQLWEHGQLYVAFSRFKDPQNICILLPELNEDSKDDPSSDLIIDPVADKTIVNLVQNIEENCKASCNEELSRYCDIKRNYLTDSSSTEFLGSDKQFLENMNKYSDIKDNYLSDSSSEEFSERQTVGSEEEIGTGIEKIFDKYGLFNIGNTCYINSILQIMSHIGKFIDEIENYEATKEDETVISIMQQFFAKINTIPDTSSHSVEKQALNPQMILDVLHIDYESFIQEDVGEICERFFNIVASHCPDIIDKYFTFTGFQKVIHASGMISLQEFNMNIFQIPIDLQTHSNELLFTNLLDNELADCRVSDEFDSTKFQTIIKRFIKLPKVLCFYLKRVQFSNDFQQFKTNIKVIFDEVIQFPLTISDNHNEMVEYELFGIIIHIGSKVMSGHYTSFIKMKNEWFYFDDKNVFHVTSDIVQNDSFGGFDRSASMLFYIDKTIADSIGMITFDITKILSKKSSIVKNKDFQRRMEFFCDMLFPKEIVEKVLEDHYALSNEEILDQFFYPKRNRKKEKNKAQHMKEKN